MINKAIFQILTNFKKFRSRKLDLRELNLRLSNLNSNGESILKDILKEFNSNEFKKFEKKFNYDFDKLKIFDNLPFQCGGIDDELPLIIYLVKKIQPVSILEIGVANGFSSKHLLNEVTGYSTSKNVKMVNIDLPYFDYNRPSNWYNKLLNYLVKENYDIKLNKNVSDIKPGGVIPNNKYANWLTTPSMRLKIPYYSFYGNVFNVLPEIETDFDFILIDAMKDYENRLKLLELVNKKTSKNSIIILDGEWINNAMKDFARNNNSKIYEYGRIGIFVKNAS